MPFLTQGKTNVKYLFIVIVLAIFVGGLIVALSKLTECPCWWPSNQHQQVLPTDEPADWQTHRNEEYGFEFKYPIGWAAIESVSPGNPYLAYITLGSQETIQEGGFFAVSIRNQTEEEYLSSLAQEGFNIVSQEEITLLEEKATVYTLSKASSPGITWKILIIKKNGNLLEFSKGATLGYDEIFNQMLSTFKFIEPTTEPAPIIDNISPDSGLVGTSIEIRGKNFSGFEGDLNAWVENTEGIKGIIYGNAGSNDNLIKFTLSSSYCQVDTSYSGLACPDFIYLTPGIYKIYVMPWGQKSNEISFTITSQ